MIISGIIPFIAGPIRRWILKFFTKKKEEPPKTEESTGKFDDSLWDTLPPEIKEEVYKVAKDLFTKKE